MNEYTVVYLPGWYFFHLPHLRQLLALATNTARLIRKKRRQRRWSGDILRVVVEWLRQLQSL